MSAATRPEGLEDRKCPRCGYTFWASRLVPQGEICPHCSTLPEPDPRDTEIECLRARLAEAQETNTRLNRRCQEAESIANSKMDEAGARVRTVGRALANAAASRYLRERDESRAECISLREAARRLLAVAMAHKAIPREMAVPVSALDELRRALDNEADAVKAAAGFLHPCPVEGCRWPGKEYGCALEHGDPPGWSGTGCRKLDTIDEKGNPRG